MMRKVIYRIGERAKISTEEPLYDRNRRRIDGQTGRVVDKKIKNGVYVYDLSINGRRVEVGRGLIAAPSWYYKLSVQRMEELNRTDKMSFKR